MLVFTMEIHAGKVSNQCIQLRKSEESQSRQLHQNNQLSLLITCCPNCNGENTHSATAEDGGTVNTSFAAFLHGGRLPCSSCLHHYLAVSVAVVMGPVVAM